MHIREIFPCFLCDWMRRCTIAHLVACASLTIAGQYARSQMPDANWLAPLHATPQRDADALALVRAALSAANPAQAPAILDEDLSFEVSTWGNVASTGVLHERSLGLATEYERVMISGITARTLSRDGLSATLNFAGQQSSVESGAAAMEYLPYVPEVLLNSALNSPFDDVISLPSSGNSEKVVRIVSKAKYWQPEMRSTGTTTYDVSINPITFLVTDIAVYVHTQGDIRFAVPRKRTFSDYKSVAGRMLPTSLNDTLDGYIEGSYTLTSALFNQGFTKGNLQF